MSWEPEIIIVAGYRIPNKYWADALENADKNPLFEEYEDFFLDPDPISGTEDCYFGKIIRSFGFDCADEAVDMNTIYANLLDIDTIQKGFHAFFDDFIPKDEMPSFTKWIVGRWI